MITATYYIKRESHFTSLKLCERLFSLFSKHLYIPCAIFSNYPSCFMHERRQGWISRTEKQPLENRRVSIRARQCVGNSAVV